MSSFVFAIVFLLLAASVTLGLDRMPDLSNGKPVLVTCRPSNAHGDWIIFELRPDWAPIGVERFLQLVLDGFFNGAAFFRVVKDFLVQFGIAADPAVHKAWRDKGTIRDDSKATAPKGAFKRGYLSFAGGGTDSRTTELFIAFKDSTHLGAAAWETPIGFVKYGMEFIDKLYAGYGDVPPFGNGPSQTDMYEQGSAYIKAKFPLLDTIEKCSIMVALTSEDGSDDEANDDDGGDESDDADEQDEDEDEDKEKSDADAPNDAAQIDPIKDAPKAGGDAQGSSAPAFLLQAVLFVAVVAGVYGAWRYVAAAQTQNKKKFDD
jgi:cyclophilin family peptidyl-prolyl cis-trans isomerase